MTKEDWKFVEERLSSPFGFVKLNIDGYDVALTVEPVKPLKYVIVVYVDDKIKGEWLMNDCDIRNRFYKCSKHSLLSTKEKNELKKRSKKFRDYMLNNSIYYTYEPCWKSFKSMKAHLIKNNNSIVLIKKAD